MAETSKCSKCGEERDTAGYPKWCRACRAKYKRDYEEIVKTMDKGNGFGQGVAAMRELLATEFEKFGLGRFTGDEIATLIRQAPGPQREEEKKEA